MPEEDSHLSDQTRSQAHPSREFTRAPTMARILSLYRQMLHPSQPLTARGTPQRIAPADEWVDSGQR